MSRSRAVLPHYSPFVPSQGEWININEVPPRKFHCAYCDADTGSKQGWVNVPSGGSTIIAQILVCQNCNQPTYFEGSGQVPASGLGKSVEHVPEPVDSLYREARRCTTVGAYTGAALLCRTLLMYVAVQKGAGPGRDFPDYMNYLASKAYIPHDSKKWVERLIKMGGEAAHAVTPKGEQQAEDILTFAEMLLKNVYEMPAR